MLIAIKFCIFNTFFHKSLQTIVFQDTDEEVDGKRKTKKKTPRQRKPQTEKNDKDLKDSHKAGFSKKLNRLSTSPSSSKKDLKSVYRKRSNSVKKSKDKKLKKIDDIKCEYDEEIEKNIKPGSTEGQTKRLMEDSVEWEMEDNLEDNAAISEDAAEYIKHNSPEQQTAESESGNTNLVLNKKIVLLAL